MTTNEHELPSHENLSVELLELSPDLLGRLVDGELHLYTDSLVDALEEAKTIEEFEQAVESATIVELDPDEMYSLWRLLSHYYESLADEFDGPQTIH